MKAILSVFIIFAAASIASPALAHENPNCNPRELMHKILNDNYNEEPMGFGIEDNTGYLLEILASPEGKTWSITITDPKNKKACYLAGGTHLRMHKLRRAPDSGTPELLH